MIKRLSAKKIIKLAKLSRTDNFTVTKSSSMKASFIFFFVYVVQSTGVRNFLLRNKIFP